MMNEVKTAMRTVKLLLKDGQIEKGTKLFVEKVTFGNGSWKAVFDERARSAMTANYHTWLDQSNDPERLSIQPQKLNNFSGKITGITGTCSIPVYPAVIGELKKIVAKMQIRNIQGAGHGGPVSHVAETVAIIEEHLETDKCAMPINSLLST